MSENLFDDELVLEDLADIPVEVTQENVYISEFRREACLTSLKDIRDGYLRLISLNKAVSVFLNTQAGYAVTSTLDKLKVLTNKEDNRTEINTCREQLQNKLPRLEVEIEEGKRLSAAGISRVSPDGFTISDMELLANVIPESLGRSEYALLLTKAKDNHHYGEELLTLDELIAFRDLIKATLYYCREDVKGHSNKELTRFNLISDVSVDRSHDESDAGVSGYQVPMFDMSHNLEDVLNAMQRLDKDVTFGDDAPTVYVIRQVEEIEDSYQNKEYLKFTLDLYFSTRADAQETKVIFRPATFANQMHIIGVSNVHVKGIPQSLAEVSSGFLESVAALYDIKDIEASNDSIIRVPYFLSENSVEGEDYIVLGEFESPFHISALENSQVEGYPNYLAFLREVNAKRIASTTPIWYTSITASNSATPDLIDRIQTSLFAGGSEARYTGEELLQIAKSKNAKKLISSYYNTKPTGGTDTLDPITAEKASAFMALDSRIMKQCKALNGDIRFAYSDMTTPNRTIITQAIMQKIEKPVHSRYDIESIFNANKKSIMDIVLPQIFAKYQFDRENIGLILGTGTSKSTFYEYISSGRYALDPKFSVSLKTVDILDSIAMVYRLRLRGFVSQDFSDDTIRKVVKDGEGVTEESTFTRKEFIKEFIKIHENPMNLLDAWGVIPNVGERIDKSSSARTNILTALVEAYQIYTLLLAEDDFNYSVSFATSNEVKGEEEDMLNFKYNKALAPTAELNGYNAVKEYGLSKEFYEGYCQYLTRHINNVFLTKKPISTDFDGGMIINAYIRALHELSQTEKTLYYRLFHSSAGLQDAQERPGNMSIDSIVEDIELGDTVTLQDMFERLDIRNELSEEDEIRLTELYMHTVHLVNLTTVPVIELCYTLIALANEGALETFNEGNKQKYLLRLGFDADGSLPDFNVKFDIVDHYTPANVKASIEEGLNLYVLRDASIITTVLRSAAFGKWVKSLETLKSEEEWQTAYETIYDVFVSKMKSYTQEKVSKMVKTIVGKVKDYVDRDALINSLQSYLVLIAPTEMDAYYLLTFINKQITNTISEKESLINIGKIKFDSISLEEIAAIEKELYEARRRNEFVMMLAPFLSIDKVLDSNMHLQEVNNKVYQLLENNRDESAYLDPRTIKKNIALYQKYLQTGNPEYKQGISLDTIPFEVLTLDMPAKYALSGPYSKRNLIYDHALVDLNDDNAKLEAINLTYMELLEMVLEQYPDYYKDCPRAIREYIMKHEANKLN